MNGQFPHLYTQVIFLDKIEKTNQAVNGAASCLNVSLMGRESHGTGYSRLKKLKAANFHLIIITLNVVT